MMRQTETNKKPGGTIIHTLPERQSPCTGKIVRKTESACRVTVLAAIRNGAVLVPSDDLLLKNGDDLILHSLGEAGSELFR